MKTLVMSIIFFNVVCHAKAQTLFIWPVKSMPAYSEVAGFYITNNFVDSNNNATVQDWNCGARTYNGHQGIDIDLWPFTWSMMDNNYVAAIAAAPGRVAAVTDNLNNENNCGQTGEDSNWNYIAIRHADSSTSFYGHLRTNSAQVTVGQFVSAGDVLAYVGSSGRSSNPHLHFEVNSRAVDATFLQIAGLIDPYAGPCNTLNTNSWWLTQKPYWEPAIVRVMTHGSRPSLPGYDNNPFPGYCRTGEIKNAKASFSLQDSIYIGIGMRDFLKNQFFIVTVYNPDGSTWFAEANTNNSNTDHPRRYYTLDKKITANAATGTYKVVVDFNGTAAVHFFSVNCPAVQNVTGILLGHQGFKASSQITSTSNLPASNRLLLQAGSKITLLPGFKASQGSIMKARIRDCNYSE
jgi:hypothetical protein